MKIRRHGSQFVRAMPPFWGHFCFWALRTVPALIMIIFSLVYAETGYKYKRVCFKNVCVRAEIADTDIKRRDGLMFREYLGLKHGMLFIFDKEERRAFWMKNMQIPLDIIWISESKKIVDVMINIAPCGNTCENLISAQKVKYVLEVNAGFVNKYRTRIGDEVKF